MPRIQTRKTRRQNSHAKVSTSTGSSSTSSRSGRTDRRGLFVGKPPPKCREIFQKPTRFYVGKPPPDEYVSIMDIDTPDDLPVADPASSRSTSPGIPMDEADDRAWDGMQNVLPQLASSSSRGSSTHSTVYNAPYHEVDEDEDVVLPEETVPHKYNPDEIPVRVLQDFVLYEIETRRLVRTEVVDDSGKYGASGVASPWVDDDDESLSDAEEVDDESLSEPSNAPEKQRLCLSGILEVNVHHPDDLSPQTFRLNPHIYIRTENAWYILKDPALVYVEYFTPFQIKHHLFHELVSLILQDPDRELTLQEFKYWLSDPSTSGIPITWEHLASPDAIHYISETFDRLCQEYGNVLAPLRDVPVLEALLGPSSSKAPSHHVSKSLKAVRDGALANSNKTAVTSKVHNLAARLFPRKHLQKISLDAAGNTLHSETLKPDREYRTHGAHIRHKWGLESTLYPGHYESVTIDGVLYKAGDTVIVESGPDADKIRAKNATTEQARSGNDIIDTKWFVKICYFFEQQEPVEIKPLGTQWVAEQFFHGQFYTHGSKLLLQEMAHPQALYLIDECSDQTLGCIFRKVDVHELGMREEEPTPLAGSPARLFSGMLWDQTAVAFRQLRDSDVQEALDACMPGKECISCGLVQRRTIRSTWEATKDRLSRHGIDYHVNDFAYLRPAQPSPPSLYVIGQIIQIVLGKGKEEHRVRVRLLERYDKVLQCGWGPRREGFETDERRLVLTGKYSSFEIGHIEGKPHVVHPSSLCNISPDDWVSHDDHFLLDLHSPTWPPKRSHLQKLRDILQCHACISDRLESLQADQDILARHQPLRCLELFAGAGGLAAGLHQSGFIETKWAVESSVSAAMSFAANNPDCTVYTQCSNILLEHAIETHRGLTTKPLQSRNRKETNPLPVMPEPGEVDIICGGPPCQSFSGANRGKKVDDIRSTLICNMLSYVDFYRPKYFLLENVTGLLYFRPGAKQLGQSMVGGVSMGIVKFIFRTLISLGYQVHCKVLQAAQYGAPQSRERVIFWAARRDVPLPDFPCPTHHLAKGVRSFDLPTGEVLHRPVRVPPHELATRAEYAQYAPLRAVTVEDAIGDLTKFDWRHTAVLTEDDKARLAQGVARFDGVINREARIPYAGYGGKGTAYLHAPLNRYQKQAREGLGADDNVLYHYTQKFTAKIVNRVLHVPLRAGANHQDLPSEYRDKRKLEWNGKSKKAYERYYKRIDRDGQFGTMLTAVKPHSTNATVLHPTQKRVLTIRECARAQGFHDSHAFLSVHSVPAKVVEDQLRQIGNAVPVPLARALGKELGKVLLKVWRGEEAERGLSPEVPMEVDSDEDV